MEPRPALSGLAGPPLTPEGIAQAEAIGRRLTVPEAAEAEIVASPIGRARHRRDHRRMPDDVAAIPGRSAFDERLREISLGSWDGLDKREIRRRAPDLFPARKAAGSSISAAPTARPTMPSPDASRAFSPIRRRSGHRGHSRRRHAGPARPLCRNARARRCASQCRRTAFSASPVARSRKSRPERIAHRQPSSVAPPARPTIPGRKHPGRRNGGQPARTERRPARRRGIARARRRDGVQRRRRELSRSARRAATTPPRSAS